MPTPLFHNAQNHKSDRSGYISQSGFLAAIFGLCLSVINGCNDNPAGSGRNLTPMDVGVYSGEGAQRESIIACFSVVREARLTVDTLRLTDIFDGSVERFRLIVIPGGDCHRYSEAFGPVGRGEIRGYVQNGGGYIGFGSGGAIATSDSGIWPGIGIVSGGSEWPLPGLAPYPYYGMVSIDAAEHPGTIARRLHYNVLYNGGPAFHPVDPTELTVNYRYAQTGGIAALETRYGFGNVWVTGFQPEFEEGSPIDGTTFGDDLADNDSEWELIQLALNYCLGIR
jgi:glutamine amidotransferase-like uncharacterized protein